MLWLWRWGKMESWWILSCTSRWCYSIDHYWWGWAEEVLRRANICHIDIILLLQEIQISIQNNKPNEVWGVFPWCWGESKIEDYEVDREGSQCVWRTLCQSVDRFQQGRGVCEYIDKYIILVKSIRLIQRCGKRR